MPDLNQTLSRLVIEAIRESEPGAPLPDRIPNDGNLLADYGLTSMAVVSLVTSIERTLDIEFAEDDLDADHFVSIDTIARLLESRFPQCVPSAVEAQS